MLNFNLWAMFFLSCKTAVLFVLWQNRNDYPFLSIIKCVIFLLIWCIWMFGVHFLFLPQMFIDISLLWLMMQLGQLGFFLWRPNLKLKPWLFPFTTWFSLNSMSKSNVLGLIMPLSSNFLIFILLTASFTKLVVFKLHNKILLWRENINIFYLLLGLCKFSPICHFLFGVIVYSLLSISLIGCHLLFYNIKLPMNFYLAKFLLIPILGFLVVYVLLLPLVISPLSFLLEQESVFLLVTLTMSRVINFLIFCLTLSLSLDM